MKLSILVCSTQNRYNNFLLKILNQLFSQWESLAEELKKDVEIICITDNKQRMLGTKRNDLLNMAQGEYVVFVDDDDRVSYDYVLQLLNASCLGFDVICFLVSVSLNGKAPKICYYSTSYKEDYNTDDSYHRLPNHIMCVKKELALQVKYKDIIKGEDADYSKRLLPLLQSQFDIYEVLYHYDYSDETTETQKKIKRK